MRWLAYCAPSPRYLLTRSYSGTHGDVDVDDVDGGDGGTDIIYIHSSRSCVCACVHTRANDSRMRKMRLRRARAQACDRARLRLTRAQQISDFRHNLCWGTAARCALLAHTCCVCGWHGMACVHACVRALTLQTRCVCVYVCVCERWGRGNAKDNLFYLLGTFLRTSATPPRSASRNPLGICARALMCCQHPSMSA